MLFLNFSLLQVECNPTYLIHNTFNYL
jgi:hypothetical protein